MLKIINISKYFGSKLVLNNISFNVPKGNIYGIIGPNGAGKTTTLRIILGILTQSSGEILFKNKSNNQDFHNITGYLPEDRGLYPKSTVANILLYFAQLKGLSYSKATKNINYWLERLELSEYKKYHIEELSKGNQQKIQFITAILHNPEILILDEPFSGFDPVNQTIFTEIINEMKNDKYIILSTHLMDLAESLCDNIFLIKSGEEILSGKISDLLDNKDSNKFQIHCSELSDEAKNFLNQYKIIEKTNDKVVIDLEKESEADFIKNASNIIKISEVIRIKPSLHQLFLNKIEYLNK